MARLESMLKKAAQFKAAEARIGKRRSVPRCNHKLGNGRVKQGRGR